MDKTGALCYNKLKQTGLWTVFRSPFRMQVRKKALAGTEKQGEGWKKIQDDLPELRKERFSRAGDLSVLRQADAVFIANTVYSEVRAERRHGVGRRARSSSAETDAPARQSAGSCGIAEGNDSKTAQNDHDPDDRGCACPCAGLPVRLSVCLPFLRKEEYKAGRRPYACADGSAGRFADGSARAGTGTRTY